MGLPGRVALALQPQFLSLMGKYRFCVFCPPTTPPKALSIGQFLCYSGGEARYIPPCNASF